MEPSAAVDDPAVHLATVAAKLRSLAAQRLAEHDIDAASHLQEVARQLEAVAERQREHVRKRQEARWAAGL
jgi:hypothetical protein